MTSSSNSLPSASFVTRCRAPNLQTLARQGGEWAPNEATTGSSTAAAADSDVNTRQHEYNNRMAWRAHAAYDRRQRQRATMDEWTDAQVAAVDKLLQQPEHVTQTSVMMLCHHLGKSIIDLRLVVRSKWPHLLHLLGICCHLVCAALRNFTH